MTALDTIVDVPNEAYMAALDQAIEEYCKARGTDPVHDDTWMDREIEEWYLAGPMSGIPAFNFPAFDAAAADLRRQGLMILSPAEMDDPAERQHALDSPDGVTSRTTLPRAHFLKRDFLIVMEVKGIVVLPGWERSSGARDETRLAFALDKPVVRYPDLAQIAWDQHPYNAASRRVEVG